MLGLGMHIKEIRQEQGLTYKQVSEITRISIPKLRQIEADKKEPTPKELALIYRALGLS